MKQEPTKPLFTRMLFSIIIFIVCIVAIVVVSSFLTECASDTIKSEIADEDKLDGFDDVDEIKIGVIAPFSGEMAYFGELQQKGYELGLEEINNAGGINGKKIKLIYEDEKCQPKLTQTALKKLNDFDKVVATLGPFCGSSSKAASVFAGESKEIILTPSDNFGKLSDYSFNVAHKIKDETIYLANEAHNTLGLRNVAILYYNNDWGYELRNAFVDTFTSLGGEISTEEKYEYWGMDGKTLVTKAMSKDSDAILFIGDHSGILMRQAREVGFKGMFISDWEMENALLPEGNIAFAEGLVYSRPLIINPGSKTNNIKQFEQKYFEKHGSKFDLYSVFAYDALYLLKDALLECESQNFAEECLQEYLANIDGYQATAGTISYKEPKWGIEVPFHLKTIKDVKYVVY